jgi:DNA polymerase IV
MDRHIICYQIPAFEIAVARLEEPALRQRAVAIASSQTPQACVQDLSVEAQAEGLRPGMPMEQACRLCPSLQVLVSDRSRLRLAHQHLLEVVTAFAPVWEPVRPGHFFLDLTGTTRLFGAAVDTAARIEREATRRHGLAGVMGVASNKFVSRAAAGLLQPSQLCDVCSGSERPFLAPLPVGFLQTEFDRVLPPGRSKMILGILWDLNLHTLGEVADISVSHLQSAFGRDAVMLHSWANGVDSSPVLPPVQHPQVEIARALEPPEVDDAPLLGLLSRMLEELCGTLRRRERMSGRLTLTLLHNDRVEIARRHYFRPGTYWEVDMYPRLKELFFRCFQRRVRIRMMTLRADVLAPPDTQLSLFDHETPAEKNHARKRRLAVTLDRLRERFGDHTLYWGSGGRRTGAISPSHPGRAKTRPFPLASRSESSARVPAG